MFQITAHELECLRCKLIAAVAAGQWRDELAIAALVAADNLADLVTLMDQVGESFTTPSAGEVGDFIRKHTVSP